MTDGINPFSSKCNFSINCIKVLLLSGCFKMFRFSFWRDEFLAVKRSSAITGIGRQKVDTVTRVSVIFGSFLNNRITIFVSRLILPCSYIAWMVFVISQYSFCIDYTESDNLYKS